MNILVIGRFQKFPAEGMEVVTNSIVNAFRDDYGANVQTRSTRAVFTDLLGIIKFNPRIVVFTHGPGTGVLLMSRLLFAIIHPKIIWVATRPALAKCPRVLFSFTHVDHILTGSTSPEIDEIVDQTSACLHNVIIGVDFKRLTSHSTNHSAMRERLFGDHPRGIGPLVIHVGHIRHNRGIEKLIDLKHSMGQKVNVVVIGSPSLTIDQDLRYQLAESGVILYLEHIEDMSSVYKCADLYIFPVKPELGGAVDLPLSVIESLASGTPVVSTRFGSLEKRLNGFEGIYFTDYSNISDAAIEILEKRPINIKVGKIGGEFDLKNVARKIIEISELDE